MKRIQRWHPLFIGLFPLLQYYTSNKSESFLINLISPFIYIIIFITLLWLLFRKIFKDINKVNIAISVILLYFFSYGHIREISGEFVKKLTFFSFSKELVFLMIYSVVAVLILKTLLKIKEQQKIAGFFTIIGIYLCITPLFSIIPSEIQRIYAKENIKKLQNKDVQNELQKAIQITTDKPDIYYIVLDRYANQHVLKEYYNFDNSEFIGFLEEKGFYIADESYANYPKTFSSLASTLNLQHITNLSKIIGEDVSDNTPIFEMVQNNLVSDFMIKKGYTFIYFGSWWEPTRINKHADKNVNLYADSDEFLRKFGQTTVLNPLLAYLFKRGDILGFSDDRVRENHLYQIEKLKNIAQESSPKFVFVHMLAPHSPYVLDENCKAYSTVSDNKDSEEYINQLQCINKSFMEIIENILKESENPPIILLQSDEGPFKVDEMNKHGEGIDWTKVSDEAIIWHMKILNAYYFPDMNYYKLYKNITPVNSFRLIFNTYFETDFAFLEDKAYFIPHLNYPYKFRDITKILTD